MSFITNYFVQDPFLLSSLHYFSAFSKCLHYMLSINSLVLSR